MLHCKEESVRLTRTADGRLSTLGMLNSSGCMTSLKFIVAQLWLLRLNQSLNRF